jgi:uncharacterized protein (DUF2344 family)
MSEQNHRIILKRAEELFNMVVKENKKLKEKITKLEKELEHNKVLLYYSDNIDKNKDYYLCQICIDNHRNTVLLPCRHFFCSECISRLENYICPYCREDIVGVFEVIV